LLCHPPVLRDIVNLLQGTDVRYDLGEGAGAWVPPLPGLRVSSLMQKGRAVLLDLNGRLALEALAEHWPVDVVSAATPNAPADALLIRPDCHVACALKPGEGEERLRQALSRWFKPRA
jgi:hypothetical protein